MNTGEMPSQRVRMHEVRLWKTSTCGTTGLSSLDDKKSLRILWNVDSTFFGSRKIKANLLLSNRQRNLFACVFN